jgi:hypothetical protein
MLAAVLVLALGDGFRQVGVLGQIFAGPPAPSVFGGTVAGAAAGGGPIARSLPVIPAVAVASVRAGARAGAGGGHSHVVPVASRGPSQTAGAVGRAAPIVSSGSPSSPPPVQSAPTGSAPSSAPSPPPAPKPQPTVVDRIVATVTPITQQVPAPVGPAATHAVESAGSAADSLLPPAPPGLKLP